MSMDFIDGGVTAPKGFRAAGAHLGIRKNKTKKDVALLLSDERAATACCYTTNLVQGAPLTLTRQNLADGHAQALVCNSGNANTCNANGIEIAQGMCALVQQHTGIPAGDVVVASTGVIGQPLSLTPFQQGMGALAAALTPSREGAANAAQAIMTTDTFPKEAALRFTLGGVDCVLGGMAKGSGMICPNMATMLCFLTTDAAIAPEVLQAALRRVVEDTFHMLSVDGDTSTNDMVSLMANGLAGNVPLTAPQGSDYESFLAALGALCEHLCRMMAKDGEGAQHLITCQVKGASDKAAARAVARSVIKSSLLKAAIFGADANWGRVLCAIGYSGVPLAVDQIDVDFASRAGRVALCRQGTGVPFEEAQATAILQEDEVEILIDLHGGEVEATAWGCDLTYDYVKINGDYRT